MFSKSPLQRATASDGRILQDRVPSGFGVLLLTYPAFGASIENSQPHGQPFIQNLWHRVTSLGIACKPSGKTVTSEELQMSLTVLGIGIFLPVASIFAAMALMRMFDVKDATAEQTQAEAEKLLAQANREVNRRHHVRAGAPSNPTLTEVPRFASLSAVRIRFPSS